MHVNTFSKTYEKIVKLIDIQLVEIVLISEVFNKDVEKSWNRKKQYLKNKNKKEPYIKTFFHITSIENAKSIAKHGFLKSELKPGAFGFGINVCEKFSDLLRYSKKYLNENNQCSVIICKAVIGRAHSNWSDIENITNDKCGNFYSTPKYKYPKTGFDAMFSNNKKYNSPYSNNQRRL